MIMKKHLMYLRTISVLIILIFLSSLQKAEAKESRLKHPLVGTWTMVYQKDGHPVVCYKLLKKNGRYVNLKSTDEEGTKLAITRQGTYAVGVGEFVERLAEEHGRVCTPPVNFPLEYEFLDKNTVKISFEIGGKKYNEVWKRTKKSPQY